MSEIYKNTSQFVYLDIYGGTADETPVAELVFSDGTTRTPLVVIDTPPTGIEQRYHVVLNMADTQNEWGIKVNWSFEMDGVPVSKTDHFNVVTPILTFGEIREIHPNATDSEVIKIEAAVRHIIEALTGQNFGQFIGVKEVRGSNTRSLPLPAKLQSITDIDGATDANNFFSIEGDGYYLRHYPWGVPPIKADYYGLHQHVGGVIHNPNNVKLGEFNKNVTYSINGLWGWETVPARVKEAAKLLVNDYACGDANYRDRYLTSMTAADWRIQFNSGAFLKTGNVRADQLLSDYVLKHGWAVL